jgi:hypothetical protein
MWFVWPSSYVMAIPQKQTLLELKVTCQSLETGGREEPSKPTVMIQNGSHGVFNMFDKRAAPNGNTLLDFIRKSRSWHLWVICQI